MKTHTANELRYRASILDSDGTTVLAAGVACGTENLQGRRLEQAQLTAAETSHMILMRAGDAAALTGDGYVLCEGELYIVDYKLDPATPRPRMWTEIFCHVERRGN